MVAANDRFLYAIDRGNVISYVSPGWLAFARENGAAELTSTAVVGRPLCQFISGTETQQLYESIIERVRTQTSSVVIPFRCDSPTLRRFMRLKMTRQPNGVVQFEGTIDRVQPCHYSPILDRTVRRSNQQLTLCSCCKRALIEPTGWLDLEAAASYLRLFEETTAPSLRQVVCPRCAQLG